VLKQSTAVNVTVVMIDSTDHVTGKTGLTLTIKASKAAAAFASITPTVTELEGGIYKLAFTTSHTDTLGELRLRITSTGADESDPIWQVVALLPGDGVTVATNNDKTGYSLAASQHVIVDSGTVTTLTNLPSIPSNWLTAAGITAGALNGKGDWLLSSSYTAPPSAATIASATWQDTAAGDFTTALSIGKSVLNGVSLGTGLTINAYTGNTPQTGDAYARIGAAGAGLTALGDTRVANLDAAVSSRMATYTQPTGFLAATFPSGTVANTTNITAGTITTATNLTNLPSIPANWLTAAGIAANALNGKGDWLLASSYSAPPSAAAIATTIWQDLTSSSDFTTTGSIGKRLADDLDATISSRSTYVGADTSGTITLLTRIPSALTITTGKVDVNDKTGFSLTSGERTSIWATPIHSLQAGELLWRVANRPGP
jgi:hypothetical protein